MGLNTLLSLTNSHDVRSGMAYDIQLAERLRSLTKSRKGFTSKKMFGGIGFMLNGNMCFGVYKEFLILRLGDEPANRALRRDHTRPFDITGRAMSGWVMVGPAGVKSDTDLKKWSEAAVAFVRSLPPK